MMDPLEDEGFDETFHGAEVDAFDEDVNPDIDGDVDGQFDETIQDEFESTDWALSTWEFVKQKWKYFLIPIVTLVVLSAFVKEYFPAATPSQDFLLKVILPKKNGDMELKNGNELIHNGDTWGVVYQVLKHSSSHYSAQITIRADAAARITKGSIFFIRDDRESLDVMINPDSERIHDGWSTDGEWDAEAAKQRLFREKHGQ